MSENMELYLKFKQLAVESRIRVSNETKTLETIESTLGTLRRLLTAEERAELDKEASA